MKRPGDMEYTEHVPVGLPDDEKYWWNPRLRQWQSRYHAITDLEFEARPTHLRKFRDEVEAEARAAAQHPPIPGYIWTGECYERIERDPRPLPGIGVRQPRPISIPWFWIAVAIGALWLLLR